MGCPGGSAGKASACNAGDLGSVLELGRSPEERKGYPTPVFRPGEFHGLYSPWGRKESDTMSNFQLICIIMEAGKSKICKVGWHPRDPRKSQCCSSSLKPSPEASFLLRGCQSLLSLSTDGMRLPHIIKGNLLSSNSRMISLIKKT